MTAVFIGKKNLYVSFAEQVEQLMTGMMASYKEADCATWEGTRVGWSGPSTSGYCCSQSVLSRVASAIIDLMIFQDSIAFIE